MYPSKDLCNSTIVGHQVPTILATSSPPTKPYLHFTRPPRLFNHIIPTILYKYLVSLYNKDHFFQPLLVSGAQASLSLSLSLSSLASLFPLSSSTFASLVSSFSDSLVLFVSYHIDKKSDELKIYQTSLFNCFEQLTR
jgi:predicted AAA+ superfamily ATPase